MISVDTATPDGVDQAGTAVIECKTFHDGLACHALNILSGQITYNCNRNHEKSCKPTEEDLFLSNSKRWIIVNGCSGNECVQATEGSFDDSVR